jgi:glycogen debranching enzyme
MRDRVLAGDARSAGMEDPDGNGDLSVAAGLPWFLALFGRDAILTTLMALPFDRELAAGVLRTLARHQGRRVDDSSEEQPGRILHEMRFGGWPPGRAGAPTTERSTRRRSS